MKHARYDAGQGPRAGLVEGEEIVDLADAGFTDVISIVRGGDTALAAIASAAATAGSRRPLHIRALPARYYLKGGLYGWFQGDDKGKLHSAHERWDLRLPDARRIARTLSDHVIEVRDGDNIGWGMMEYGVGAGYDRYPDVQRHPPI